MWQDSCLRLCLSSKHIFRVYVVWGWSIPSAFTATAGLLVNARVQCTTTTVVVHHQCFVFDEYTDRLISKYRLRSFYCIPVHWHNNASRCYTCGSGTCVYRTSNLSTSKSAFKFQLRLLHSSGCRVNTCIRKIIPPLQKRADITSNLVRMRWITAELSPFKWFQNGGRRHLGFDSFRFGYIDFGRFVHTYIYFYLYIHL